MPYSRHSLRRRLVRRLADQTGLVAVIAIGSLAALGLFGASAVAFSTDNMHNASYSTAAQQAFALAEAGVNNAIGIIANPDNDPTNGALLPGASATYEAGTATWSGVYDAAASSWTITAVGEVRNPNGAAAPVRRRITATVPVTLGAAQPIQTLANDAWNYVVALRTGNTCDMTLSSSVVAGAPIYAFGNLCLGSTSLVTAGPLAVRGTLTLGSGSAVGSLSSPVSAAHIAGGCGGGPCSAAVGVHASLITQSPPALSAPAVDWDFWYANAAPGPRARCDASSGTVPVFDNNTTRDRSVTTVTSLTPASSFSCRVGPAGSPTGELTWDAATRTLTVAGTIFIDGQVRIDNGRVNTYRGQGVLYTSGAFSATNGTKLCAAVLATDCDFTPGVWDPNRTFFAVVSNGNGGLGVLTGNSIQLGCLDRFQGGLYGTHAVYFSAGTVGAKHHGPIVGSTVVLSSAAEIKPFGTLRTVPRGLPGQPVSSPRGVGQPQYATG